jgi:hypothetical protein
MAEHQYTQQPKKKDNASQKQTIPPKQIPTSHPATIIQRARINPKSLTHADVMQLQHTIGNRAVGKLLTEIGLVPSKPKQAQPVQMQTIPEEEKEPLQGKMVETIQHQEIPEEEPLQGKVSETTQRLEPEVENKPLKTTRENNTGLPYNLKDGVENLSGIDMSDVRVHYNSEKPAAVGALAYTQGTNIHVAPGQERHLPHEAWHVVQQAQGRVRPMIQLKGVAVNKDVGLEREADEMGAVADSKNLNRNHLKEIRSKHDNFVIQKMIGFDRKKGTYVIGPNGYYYVIEEAKMAHMQTYKLKRVYKVNGEIVETQEVIENVSDNDGRFSIISQEQIRTSEATDKAPQDQLQVAVHDSHKSEDDETSEFKKEVLKRMYLFQLAVDSYGDGTKITNVKEFEDMFHKAGIQGALHTSENESLKSPQGRTSLIEIIRAALKLATQEIKDKELARIRIILLSEGFKEEGCIAAQISNLSEKLGVTNQIIETVDSPMELMDYDEKGKVEILEEHIINSYPMYIEAKSHLHGKKDTNYQDLMMHCNRALLALEVLRYLKVYLNEVKQKPSSIVSLFNQLSILATKMGEQKNHSSREALIIQLGEKYETFSEYMNKIVPRLLTVAQNATFSDGRKVDKDLTLENIIEYMTYGTLPEKLKEEIRLKLEIEAKEEKEKIEAAKKEKEKTEAAQEGKEKEEIPFGDLFLNK